jgi:hypothetical protein
MYCKVISEMIEILRTQQIEVALSAYQTWVDRSIKLGFYPTSVALVFNGRGWSILIAELLNQAYLSTIPF